MGVTDAKKGKREGGVPDKMKGGSGKQAGENGPRYKMELSSRTTPNQWSGVCGFTSCLLVGGEGSAEKPLPSREEYGSKKDGRNGRCTQEER